MYTVELGKQNDIAAVSDADAARRTAFEARVAPEKFIEPKDWRPIEKP